MNKRLYFTLVTISFGLVSVPAVLTVVFQENMLPELIDQNLLKTILIIFICAVEAGFIYKRIARIIGRVLPLVLLIGIIFRIMHWPWAYEIIAGAGIAIIANLTAWAIIEKNKGLINYLLFFFIFQRLIIILTPPNETLWWTDVVVAFVITLVGMVQLSKLIYKQEINSR